ncbi:MAG TPA: AI-2E family transporter [Planctomycetota bacterium]
MISDPSARRFFYLLLAGATVLMVLVVRSLATALFLATVLAVLLWPVHGKLAARLGNRPKVSATVVVLGVVLLLVVPLAALSTFLVREGGEGLKFVATLVRSEGLGGLVKKLPDPLEKWALEGLARVPENWEPRGFDRRTAEEVTAAGVKTAAAVGVAAKATGSLVFQAVMMLIAFFFLLRHGGELVAWLDDVLPLPHRLTRELLSEFKTVTYAVVVSTVVTAAVQTVAALIGFTIARVPYPLFFGSVTFFAAFVPAIGAAAVCLLAALILLTTGHPYMALFLAIWGFVVVGLVDNLIKPLLIRSGMKMSGAIVFFALVGGLAAFGTAGLLMGPLVVAFFLALLRIYKRDFKLRALARPGEG